MLIVGSNAGKVSYSTDGGATWTKINAAVGGTAAGNVSVTATGLATDDYIYAVSDNHSTVSRMKIGTDTTFLTVTAGSSGNVSYGLELVGGTLYVLASNGCDTTIVRSLSPSRPGGELVTDGTASINGTSFPAGLKVSSGTDSNILWVVDRDSGADDSLYYYEDTLAIAGPELTGPADGYLVQINAASGDPYNIPLTWNRVSLSSGYLLDVALDSDFVQKLTPTTGLAVGGPGPSVSHVLTSSGTGADVILQPGNSYYWRIRANTPILSPNSEVRSFTVQPGAAAVPTIGSPANGTTTEATNPAYSWSPVSGVDTYKFQLSTTPSFVTTLVDVDVETTGIKPIITLDADTTYFWRVRSQTPVVGDWSTIANFTVAEPAPVVEPTPPVVVKEMPAPEIVIQEAPAIPDIILESPPPPDEIAPAYIWAIIIIGAILVIAVVVLIVRTRRTV
jgi:hypothetical protein